MSRQYTKVPANKGAPRKKMVRPIPKISTALKGSGGFKRVGK